PSRLEVISMRWCVCFLLFVPAAAWAQAPAAGSSAAAPAIAPTAPPALAPPASAPAPAPAAAPPARSAFTGAPVVAGPTAPPVAAPAPAGNHGPPQGHTGFQMHFVPLTGVIFPFGDATGGRGDALSARYSWQWM